MDPFGAEGELINIHNHFHQGQYQEVVDFDTSALSPENALPARVLALRARIALGQADDVIADVQGESKPELAAVGALAQHSLGKTDAAVKTIEELASSSSDNATVQTIGGIVLQAAGKSEEALALLSQHSGNRGSTLYSIRGFSARTRKANRIISRGGCSHHTDPSAAEPDRPGPQGGQERAELGSRQLAGQPGRVLGWRQNGMFSSLGSTLYHGNRN